MPRTFVFLVLLTVLVRAQTSVPGHVDSDQEVRAVQRQWMEAMNKGDREALEQIIADTFTLSTPRAAWKPRNNILIALRQGRRCSSAQRLK